MAVTFEPGQPFEVELPGGRFAGRVIERNGDNVDQWIIVIDGKVEEEEEGK